jgi:predicted nucleotidyltransferase
MSDTSKQAPTLEMLRARREEILALAERYGASDVRVFGSVARGEAHPESDVDLLVSMRAGASMFDLVGLWLDLKDLLRCEVSLLTDDEHPRREHLMQRVRGDAVPL